METPVSGRFIDPFTDFGFKRIFGSEPNKDLLIDFLNQLFSGQFDIKDLTFNKNEHFGVLKSDRKAIFDLLCTASDGRQFIVEVQRVNQQHFKDRCLFYTSTLIREQAPVSMPNWDYELTPVFLVGLMEFALADTPQDEYLHNVQLVNTKTGDLFYDKLGFVFVEITKFNKLESELISELDKWLFLLKNLNKIDKIPVILRKAVFSKLFAIAEVMNLNREEKMAYDASLKEKWDNYSTMKYAIMEGEKKGEEKGRKEEKIEIAREMKKRGLEISLISELTGLTVEVITSLV